LASVSGGDNQIRQVRLFVGLFSVRRLQGGQLTYEMCAVRLGSTPESIR
jgi:hypothetical protein